MFKQQIKLICACFIVIAATEIDATLVRQTHTFCEQKTHLYPQQCEVWNKSKQRLQFFHIANKTRRKKSTAAHTNITKQEKVPCSRHRRREKILSRVGVGTAQSTTGAGRCARGQMGGESSDKVYGGIRRKMAFSLVSSSSMATVLDFRSPPEKRMNFKSYPRIYGRIQPKKRYRLDDCSAKKTKWE